MRPILMAAALFVALQCPSLATPADQISKLTGMHERSNRAALKRTLGVDPVRVPWCGAAVAWAVRKAGRKPPAGYMRAISWKQYGKAVTIRAARRGDIVVVKNRRGNHVSIVTKVSGGKVCATGGNQSNRVKQSCYSARSVVAVRR